MYDAIDANAIPVDAEIIAGYVDGPLSQWTDSEWERFPPTTPRVEICTWGPRHNGNCLDIESGDSIPDDIPDWADNAVSRGVRFPIIYCALADFPLCREIAGVRPIQWWIAHPTNIPHIVAGADATQWGWNETITGGAYDLSLCQPWFPRT